MIETRTPGFDAALDDYYQQQSSETRHCQDTGAAFRLSPEEVALARTLRVPFPAYTFSAGIRHLRAFVAGFDLFRRTLTDGREVVSMFDPESPVSILPATEWHERRLQDAFVNENFHYDPSQSFFDQWQQLSERIPRPAIVQDPKNEKSEWSVYTFAAKNCYQTFGGGMVEHLLYSDQGTESKHSSDLCLCDHTEWSYDCVHCPRCHHAFFSERCEDCVDIAFCLGCINCQDCFGCTNLKGKKFCFLNEQLSEKEYRVRRAAIDLQDANVVEKWRKTIREDFWIKAPRRGSHNPHSERVYGDDHNECRDTSGISLYASERVYCSFAAMNSKDSLLVSSIIGERIVNSTYIFRGYENRMCFSCTQCIDVEYCELLEFCEHCFGCIGLINKQFCIFNRQYSETAYWALVDEIKTTMLAQGEYGLFFPYRCSPFAYNISHASTLYPLSKEDVQALGGRWYEFPDTQTDALAIEALPVHLNETTEDILQKAYRCPESRRAFRIVKPELDLHRTLEVALPRLHPTVRRKARMQEILPVELWSRSCDQCHSPFQSRLSPEQPSQVLCDDCFEQLLLRS